MPRKNLDVPGFLTIIAITIATLSVILAFALYQQLSSMQKEVDDSNAKRVLAQNLLDQERTAKETEVHSLEMQKKQVENELERIRTEMKGEQAKHREEVDTLKRGFEARYQEWKEALGQEAEDLGTLAPTPNGSHSPRVYNETVNQGIQFLTDDKFEEAKKVFEAAHRNLPERGVADTLVHLTDKLVANSKAPAGTDWQALERDLNELKNSIYSTARIEAFAVDLLEKADREQQYIAIVSQGIDRLRAGDSDKALEMLEKVPKDSPSYEVAKPHIAKARENLRVNYENLAKNAEAIQAWKDAMKYCRLASRYADDLDAYAERFEKCRKWQTDSNMLDEGRKAFDEERYDAVKPLLADILEDSPYRKEANALIEELEAKMADIDQVQILARITQLYLAGKGEEALKLIEDDQLEDKVDQALLAKINRVLKAMKDADAAMQVKNYDEAGKKWQEVTETEPDEENQYHKQALEKLDEFERRRPEFAKDYEGRAAAANKAGKFQDARSLAKKAMGYDLEGTRGAGLIKALDEQARAAHGQGLLRQQKDPPDLKKAAEFFKRARELAEPGSFHDTDSQRRLMQMGLD